MQENIKTINLNENNIFLLNTLKKIRAFYFETQYKNSSDNEDNDNSQNVISITDGKILSLTKLGNIYNDIIKSILTEYQFLTVNKKKYTINIDNIKYYFDNVDTKAIEDEYLSKELVIEKSTDILKITELSFQEKVQKIYKNLEVLEDNKNTLNQLITEQLEANDEYLDIKEQIADLQNQLALKKDEILSTTSTLEKFNEVKKEVADEKSIFNEFLEFSIENGEYKQLEILNKEGEKLIPQIDIKMKKAKKSKNNN